MNTEKQVEIEDGAISATIDMMKDILDNMSFAYCKTNIKMQQRFIRNVMNNFIGNFYLEHCVPDKFEEALKILFADLTHFLKVATQLKKEMH